MYALTISKAYLLGCNDPQYQDILKAICGTVFLATPHRGSGLADTLNRLLQLSGQSPKEYVSELQKNSSRIRDINDQFRLHASKFQIVSFFETFPTSMGLKKTVISALIIQNINYTFPFSQSPLSNYHSDYTWDLIELQVIVERDSAVLDYPDEISSPLNADHHNVCKYTSPQDSNYISVKNVISAILSKVKMKIKEPSISSPGAHPENIGFCVLIKSSDIRLESSFFRSKSIQCFFQVVSYSKSRRSPDAKPRTTSRTMRTGFL